MSQNETIYCSQGIWKGKQVWVDHQEIQHCPVEGHALQMLNDEYGEPIGFLMCPFCGGYADDEELCEQLYDKG